jgi:hypothetical protein
VASGGFVYFTLVAAWNLGGTLCAADMVSLAAPPASTISARFPVGVWGADIHGDGCLCRDIHTAVEIGVARVEGKDLVNCSVVAAFYYFFIVWSDDGFSGVVIVLCLNRMGLEFAKLRRRIGSGAVPVPKNFTGSYPRSGFRFTPSGWACQCSGDPFANT